MYLVLLQNLLKKITATKDILSSYRKVVPILIVPASNGLNSPLSKKPGAIDATEILSDVHVYANCNAIVVEGAVAWTQVSVIGLSGYTAQNAVADGSTLSLTIEQKGLFLVKVGTSVFKVIL